jgi:phospholipase C
MLPRIRALSARLASIVVLGAAASTIFAAPHAGVHAASGAGIPIKHVVVIYQENHSFNEILGSLCVRHSRCKGSLVGKLHTGKTIRLRQAPDIVPGLRHTIQAQRKAMDGGRMDGFSRVHGCTPDRHYACYELYREYQIPNLSALARHFVIADHTFESDVVSSWGSHIELVAARLDGFTGDNPVPAKGLPMGPGWGCDSNRDAPWRAPSGNILMEPSCIPKKDGTGPYRPSPVQYIPTIMDRLGASGRSWRIFRPPGETRPRLPYGWAICPTFAECQYSNQQRNVAPDTRVIHAAKAGTLTALSIVIPQGRNSQHNGWSMRTGDNWIASVVGAVMHGPQWKSTAIFITYDDCGCFYDEVRPPSGMGIRVPMVIVSPYARPSFTDPKVASSYTSILAFTERVFGLQPLSRADANAYDYFGAFNFTQKPLPPIDLTMHPLPRGEQAWLRAHPPKSDKT